MCIYRACGYTSAQWEKTAKKVYSATQPFLKVTVGVFMTAFTLGSARGSLSEEPFTVAFRRKSKNEWKIWTTNTSQTFSHNLEGGLYGKHSCGKNCWQKQVAKCLVELLVETLASKFCSSIVIHQTHKKTQTHQTCRIFWHVSWNKKTKAGREVQLHKGCSNAAGDKQKSVGPSHAFTVNCI